MTPLLMLAPVSPSNTDDATFVTFVDQKRSLACR
jgi:hypothetical protein